MGPSGSGKTTLLDCLASRKRKGTYQQGQITINDGSEASSVDMQNISSYVEQEDALIGSLTVRETLDFAARLSLSRYSVSFGPMFLLTNRSLVNRFEHRKRVDDLLVAFGLHKQADTIVGTPIRRGISGGQKRRLTIASQLITAPKILFLDEPTSGLDSKASFEVIRYLKNVVIENKVCLSPKVSRSRWPCLTFLC